MSRLSTSGCFATITRNKSFRLAIGTILCVIGLNRGSTSAREPNINANDRNGDGYVTQKEILAEDRTAILRYASLAGLDITKPLPRNGLILGRQIYFQKLEHRGEPGSVWDQPADGLSFGRLPGASGVRPFGPAGDVDVEYSDEVRNRASHTFGNFDNNRDGVLSVEEVRDAHPAAIHEWFRADRNDDHKLSYFEMAHYFAADIGRRNISEARNRSDWTINGVTVTAEHRQAAKGLFERFDEDKNRRVAPHELPPNWSMSKLDANGDNMVTLEEMYLARAEYLGRVQKKNAEALLRDSRQKIDQMQCSYAADNLIRRYDSNRDNMLSRQSGEWRQFPWIAEAADSNKNGNLDAGELGDWMYSQLQSQPEADFPLDMPVWFLERDTNRDEQVSLSEYVATGRTAAFSEFEGYDHNRDGFITAQEAVSRSGGGKTRYAYSQPRLIEAGNEIFAEITITDDITIADVDVYVAIAMNGDDLLELSLVGPDRTTASLFFSNRYKAWSNGRQFNNTLIDEEAPYSRQRLPRPPAHRSFRPQGMLDDDRQSLSAFYGQPARGTWRLVIRNNARIAGLLEGWALFVKPESSLNSDRR